MTELCQRYDISRETGYLTLHRYRASGLSGLLPQSHAAHQHSNQTREEIEQKVLELRQAHMLWGPRKLKRILERDEPGRSWPATSTIGALLQREGLVVARKKRLHTAPYSEPLAHAQECNRVWLADFKGCFAAADSQPAQAARGARTLSLGIQRSASARSAGHANASCRLPTIREEISVTSAGTGISGEHAGAQCAAAWPFSLEATRRVFERSAVGRKRGTVARRRPLVHYLLCAVSHRPLRQPKAAGDALVENGFRHHCRGRGRVPFPANPYLRSERPESVRHLPGLKCQLSARPHILISLPPYSLTSNQKGSTMSPKLSTSVSATIDSHCHHISPT